uniref:Transposase n=1 Tax=Bursaphelenchus xylophilus TaxID=6326 RepID=A0A1I7SIP1_BURXY
MELSTHYSPQSVHYFPDRLNRAILIKTNYELIQILRAYDGANDVLHPASVKRSAPWRREQLKNYTFDDLELFRYGKAKDTSVPGK